MLLPGLVRFVVCLLLCDTASCMLLINRLLPLTSGLNAAPRLHLASAAILPWFSQRARLNPWTAWGTCISSLTPQRRHGGNWTRRCRGFGGGREQQPTNGFTHMEFNLVRDGWSCGRTKGCSRQLRRALPHAGPCPAARGWEGPLQSACLPLRYVAD